jgi:hypothetical protein
MASTNFGTPGSPYKVSALEDGAHPILNPDRLRLQDFVILIIVQVADQRGLQFSKRVFFQQATSPMPTSGHIRLISGGSDQSTSGSPFEFSNGNDAADSLRKKPRVYLSF